VTLAQRHACNSPAENIAFAAQMLIWTLQIECPDAEAFVKEVESLKARAIASVPVRSPVIVK
jgi:hypothetical protein